MNPKHKLSQSFAGQSRIWQQATVSGAVIAALLTAGILVRSDSGSAEPGRSKAASAPNTTVELTPSQLSSIKIETVGNYAFPVDKDTVGTISFADDLTVPVFPSYQGKILTSLAQLGDNVQKGQPLFTVESPDLIQAESTLIGAAATLELTNKELTRARNLTGPNGVSDREVEQATSDQQTAEGALRAARHAVVVFGKSSAEVDQMIASRKIDPVLVVASPITGQITAFNAPVGLLAQPGNAPAPYTVTNVTEKWMLADVVERDLSLLRVGQPVSVRVMAYPARTFRGAITKIYPNVDPNTHRVTVRSSIADPKNELRPGMLGNFVIRIEKPVEAVAIPANGVVREPDGTMTAWVTADERHFTQRIIKIGLRTDNEVQVVGGLQPGELVVSDGAVFLSNMLNAPPSD